MEGIFKVGFILILLGFYLSGEQVQGRKFNSILQRVTSIFSGTGNGNGGTSRILAPKEAFMTTPELIRHHGNLVEKHTVQTDDGYILTLFRISMATKKKVEESEGSTKNPVLLLHGTFSSSDEWLLQPQSENNLPYLLLNNGHDVWLGNVRGNDYGKEHLNKIRPEDPKFYDFSQDEIGRYDVPASIRYILKTTGSTQVDVICHSMGCNVISMALLESPELNSQISKMSFLAPSNYMGHIKNFFFNTIFDVPGSTLQALSDFVSGGRILPVEMAQAVRTHGPHLCIGSFRKEICSQVINFFFGFNNAQATETTASLIMGHRPRDTSMKTLVHTSQMLKAKNFQKFDYGILNNMRMYKSTHPPFYDLNKITVPVQGFYGVNDLITVPKDVLRTLSELGNCQEKIQVNGTDWSHLDYFYGKDAKSLVYDHILNFLNSNQK